LVGKNGSRSKDVWALSPPFRHDGGAAWIANLPIELGRETDSNEAPFRSPLRLFEDGRGLGPAHAVHATIRDPGEGRYSFWSTVVYFSSSDGSDPNINGRRYSVARAERRSDARTVLRAIEPARYSTDWLAPDRPLRCAILGLGNRGWSLARLLTGLEGVEIAWLADRSENRIAELRARLRLGDSDVAVTTELSRALADPGTDIVLVTLPDHLHRHAAEAAFRAGKHVYIEKPIATTADDARAILRAWKESGRVLQIGYVLRAAPFYQAVRNVVRQGRIGPVRIISLSEQLDALHGASFMRRWHAQSAHSGGLIVHKSCHDLDLVCWLLDTRPRYVSSLGGLNTFRGPPPAPFCSQCPVRTSCAYVDNGLHERRTSAESLNPTAFGLDRCVYRADKDIVDNQVVSFELESSARGTFYLAMQGPLRTERRITLIGDAGRLDGTFERGSFTLAFAEPEHEPLEWSAADSRDAHGGGDWGVIAHFLNACAGRAQPPIKSTSAAMSGLVFALAAETARMTRSVVTLNDLDYQVDRQPKA
jgi:predicted dehydrogenase